MISAREVIQRGGRCQIGNDRKVKIWRDSWLPDQTEFKIISPVRNLELVAMVAVLIDEDSMQWRRDIILNCFSLYEAHQILSIPISHKLP